MATDKARKLVVVGGGPGGYPAAIKAAQLGAEIVLVDKKGIGGTCLHRGCIPTKFLLRAARDYRQLLRMSEELGGLAVPPPNLARIMERKAQVVNELTKGTLALLQKNGVRVIAGTAGFTGPRTVRVAETGEELSADAFILATGSESIRLPIEGMDLPGVMDSDQILNLDRLPGSLAIIGGGVIGLEFAQIFQELGATVSVIEMLPRVLPYEDEDISVALARLLSAAGITIHTGARVSAIAREGGRLRVAFTHDDRPAAVEADTVLVAVGRRPFLHGLGIDQPGLRLNGNAIAVNTRMETSAPGIYAVGDAVGGLMLAHKATSEGECAACNALGGVREVSYQAIPRVLYTHPEVAGVGLLEEEARARYHSLLIGRFPFAANGRAVLEGMHQGFVKIIADAATETIVGVSIVGHGAGDLIAEAAAAIHMEATLEDVAETVHAHPTLSEAIREAALDARGEAIHLPPRALPGKH